MGQARREPVVGHADQPGQGGDAPHEQKADGQIGCQRDAAHRWRQRQQHAGGHQQQRHRAVVPAVQGAAQALERLRRRQPLRRAGGPPATDAGGGHAQQTDQQRCPAVPLQRRGHAGEEAAAQVAAEQAQRQRREGRAQRDTGRAAHSAQQQRLRQHQPQPLARREAEHAQQRKLLRAPRHAERQHREHQKRTGEQRHQRQHGQVHAVRARQVAGALGRVTGLGGGGPVRQPQRGDEGGVVGARAQAQVDAAEPALCAEQVLRGGDVHHGQCRAGRVHGARHAHRAEAQRALQLQRRRCAGIPDAARRQRRHGCRVQEHGGRREHRQAVGARGRLGHQCRRHRGHAQRVHTHHAHRHPFAVRPQGIGGQLQHRAGQRHLRVRGHATEDRFVQMTARAAQFQIGLAVDRAHRACEFAQRRGVDQVHRKRQRHPQHHRHHGGGVAPRVVAQFLPGKGAQQGEHGADCAGAARAVGEPGFVDAAQNIEGSRDQALDMAAPVPISLARAVSIRRRCPVSQPHSGGNHERIDDTWRFV